ncbi:Os04g0173300 [Oryza sativa Japonica Group]|uniref:Os04g0173300 protein n=1 Tax=Oryza sativa subsp. japonica TaxID=39947 RepID=A0A0P0W7E8_ORYSJ|nr:hypothetical protein EE612_022231 [Oryza sativa]BAS87918.1 Os04g0173300 [Oryza sativa Japonica Group]
MPLLLLPWINSGCRCDPRTCSRTPARSPPSSTSASLPSPHHGIEHRRFATSRVLKRSPCLYACVPNKMIGVRFHSRSRSLVDCLWDWYS